MPELMDIRASAETQVAKQRIQDLERAADSVTRATQRSTAAGKAGAAGARELARANSVLRERGFQAAQAIEIFALNSGKGAQGVEALGRAVGGTLSFFTGPLGLIGVVTVAAAAIGRLVLNLREGSEELKKFREEAEKFRELEAARFRTAEELASGLVRRQRVVVARGALGEELGVSEQFEFQQEVFDRIMRQIPEMTDEALGQLSVELADQLRELPANVRPSVAEMFDTLQEAIEIELAKGSRKGKEAAEKEAKELAEALAQAAQISFTEAQRLIREGVLTRRFRIPIPEVPLPPGADLLRFTPLEPIVPRFLPTETVDEAELRRLGRLGVPAGIEQVGLSPAERAARGTLEEFEEFFGRLPEIPEEIGPDMEAALSSAMVGMLTAVAVGGDNIVAAMSAVMAQLAATIVPGPAGIFAGGFFGILGSLFGGGRDEPVPVRIVKDDRGEATLIVEGGLLQMSDPRQAEALANAINELEGRRIIVRSGRN